MKSINLYCDESNHLLHNIGANMILGYISCPVEKVREANMFIRWLKEKHGFKRNYEIKWTKVSNSKISFYKELIEYFFSQDYLNFRCVVANKTALDFERFGIDYDGWYYRMYYLLLSKTLVNEDKHNIYLDIKDTCSKKKVAKLKKVLCNSYHDFTSTTINRIQHIHSHEVELLQLNDLFIGAIGYCNNGFNSSDAKLAVVSFLKHYSQSTLKSSMPLNNKKFNVFIWEAK